jgi:endo-1,4-beta-mannosidase
LNGSRLGKDFSANVFHNLFNETANRPQQSISTASTISPISSNSINSLPSSNSSSPANSFDASTIEELFGVFDIKPHGEDYEETAFARRMRKKKKRRHFSP